MHDIADYVDEYGPWSLFVEPHATGRFDPAWLPLWRGDGVLAFIEDRQAAARIARSGIPAVETYGHLSDLNVSSG